MRNLFRLLCVCALGVGPLVGCDVDVGNVCIVGPCPDPLCDDVVCPPDDNVCTTEYCSGGSCYSRPVTDGRSCTYDGLSGVCVEGVCGENLCVEGVCDDGNECTDGGCAYVDGTCDFTPVVCEATCAEGTCDPADGCHFTTVEDGTECFENGPGCCVCKAGACVVACDPASEEILQCPIKDLDDFFCCPGSLACLENCE